MNKNNTIPFKTLPMKNDAFTLIELLVAVLIIAILAAIALPQYKKAVLKSKFSTLYHGVNAVAQAQEEYYLAYGAYTMDTDVLSVTAPGVALWHNGDNWAIGGSIPEGIHYYVWPKFSTVRTDKRVCRVYLDMPSTEMGKAICQSLSLPNTDIVKAATYWEYFL